MAAAAVEAAKKKRAAGAKPKTPAKGAVAAVPGAAAPKAGAGAARAGAPVPPGSYPNGMSALSLPVGLPPISTGQPQAGHGLSAGVLAADAQLGGYLPPSGLVMAAGVAGGAAGASGGEGGEAGEKRKEGDDGKAPPLKKKKKVAKPVAPDPLAVTPWLDAGAGFEEELSAPLGTPLPQASKMPSSTSRGVAATVLGVPMGGGTHPGGVPDESWLRTRMRSMAHEHGLKKVAPDCATLLSRALEQYLVGLVGHCRHIVASRQGGGEGGVKVTVSDMLCALEMEGQRHGACCTGEREVQVMGLRTIASEQAEPLADVGAKAAAGGGGARRGGGWFGL